MCFLGFPIFFPFKKRYSVKPISTIKRKHKSAGKKIIFIAFISSIRSAEFSNTLMIYKAPENDRKEIKR
jgi:hypothetical protein